MIERGGLAIDEGSARLVNGDGDGLYARGGAGRAEGWKGNIQHLSPDHQQQGEDEERQEQEDDVEQRRHFDADVGA